jgi:RNA polymerase sigma-70 factor (ECF subfamily)
LFEILMREHIDTVRAFLLASLRDAMTVEDLVQETFMTAWKILDRYDRQLPFGPWVRGIAAKMVLNHRRKLGRSRVHYCDDALLGRIDEGVGAISKLTGDTFDEKVDALRGCLSRLSDPQRDAIKLHYENGLHCKEIAARLGIGFEAVKKHLQRGRSQLYKCLALKIAAVDGPVGSVG